MIWILAAIVVIVIINLERMPEIVSKFKKDMPDILDTGKKITKELKQKAQLASKKTSKEDKKEN